MTPQQLIRQAAPNLSEEEAARILEVLYPRLVDAQEVARVFGVSRDWVYENAEALGARVLGNGPKARKRFVLAEVADGLARMNARTPKPSDEARTVLPHRASKRKAQKGRTPTGAPLLPYRSAA